MATRNSDAVPYSAEATEQLIETLAVHFGEKWKWSEIAEWTLARAKTDLPRWQIHWAREFMTNYTRSQDAFGATTTGLQEKRGTRVPRRA